MKNVIFDSDVNHAENYCFEGKNGAKLMRKTAIDIEMVCDEIGGVGEPLKTSDAISDKDKSDDKATA